MSWPQILLSAYMAMIWIGGLYRVTQDDKTTKRGQVVGSTLGVTLKPAIILLLAWWGGFYN